MNWLPSNEVLQRRANVALIVLFLAFIFLPLADTFLHLDRAPSPNENRALAAFPVVEPNLDEDKRAAADLSRIKHGPDRGDETFAEKALDPLAGAGRRQADTRGEIEGRSTSVLLQQSQKAAVYAIEVTCFRIHA